ncbi:MAG: putative toxin-antitoxin system toxin component, PIN family [Nitrospirae bacterium]|nr:putative toxin-antitoxin system toxin component, PIN family [Nitrospirota bacterium]
MPVKVVVDTNIWISSLISASGPAARLADEWSNGKFSILISEQQITELHDVFTRPKFFFKYGISRQEIENLISSIAARAGRISLKGNLELCRDPDDNIILETALSGKAKYLITSDKDITGDKKILSFLSLHGVSVISISKFLEIIKSV